MFKFYDKAVILISLFTLFPIHYLYSQTISPSVRIISGTVNGVLIEKEGKTLVIYGDPDKELDRAEMILFTHYRRDEVWAGLNLVKKGTPAVVPAGEKVNFTGSDSLWTKFQKFRRGLFCYSSISNLTNGIYANGVRL